MKAKYITTFSISFMVLATVTIIMLMLMTPQEATISVTATEKYEPIAKSQYQYENTKGLTEESLVKQYTISGQDIGTFSKYRQYVAGNSNPFTPAAETTTTTTTTANTTTTGTTGTTTTTNTTTGGITNTTTSSNQTTTK